MTLCQIPSSAFRWVKEKGVFLPYKWAWKKANKSHCCSNNSYFPATIYVCKYTDYRRTEEDHSHGQGIYPCCGKDVKFAVRPKIILNNWSYRRWLKKIYCTIIYLLKKAILRMKCSNSKPKNCIWQMGELLLNFLMLMQWHWHILPRTLSILSTGSRGNRCLENSQNYYASIFRKERKNI